MSDLSITEPHSVLHKRKLREPIAARTIVALMLREMATTYGRSPGGYLWAVLEPIAAISLLAFAFSLAFQTPPLGDSFAMFYASGYLPYMLFHDVSQKCASATRFSRPLLNFRPVGWVEIIAARFVLNTLTHLVILAIVLITLHSNSASNTPIDWAIALSAVGFTASLAIGIGAFNSVTFLAFPALERIWAIATRPLFIVSGVLFLMEDVPARYQDVLWYNPLFHISGLMRSAVYPKYDPEYLSTAYTGAIGLLFFASGCMLMRRFHDLLIEK